MPQSSAGAPEIELTNSPKMLLPLRHAWCPEGFIVTFKLETDESILVRKAQGSIEKYGMNLVIANLLTTRKEEVAFITAEGSAARKRGDAPEIESVMVEALWHEHAAYAGGFS